MAKVRGSRARGWVLACWVGGISTVVALAIVFTGGASPGGPRLAASAAGADIARGPLLQQSHSSDTACNELMQMLNLCPATTTTTTTTAPAAGGSSTPSPITSPGSSDPHPQGGGTTTSTTSGASGTPATGTPAPSGSSGAGGGSPTPASDPGTCSGAAPPVPAPSGSWHCTFDDEFNGTSVDTSKWAAETTAGTGFTTGPLFNEVCYVNDPRTISESGGYLHLSVVEAQDPSNCPGDYPEIGGMLYSYQLFSQEYGFFEVSAQMPNTSVPGLQDTLWLYPEDETKYGAWPNSGEIDYGEWYSNYSNTDFPSNKFPGWQSDPNASTYNCTISNVTPAGNFNTYALMWTPTTLTSYFDGKACLVDTYAPYVTSPDTAPQPFNQPFFLALTAALGSYSGDNYEPGTTPMPGTMNVDWMRVWQYG